MSLSIMFYVTSDQSLIIKNKSIFGKDTQIGDFSFFTNRLDAEVKGINVPDSELWKVKDFLEKNTFDVLPNSNIALFEYYFSDDFCVMNFLY